MKLKLTILSLLALLPLLCHAADEEIDSPRISKNSIKAALLSLGSGSTKITYERAFTPHFSSEVTLGRIGWGWDSLNHTQYSKGMMGKVAFKYNFLPQPKQNTWLSGMYTKPEFMFSNFRYMQPDEDFERKTLEWAAMGKIGYQLVLKWFVFDVHAGLGYAWGTGNANDYFHGYLFWHGIQHLAISTGFRIGVAF